MLVLCHNACRPRRRACDPVSSDGGRGDRRIGASRMVMRQGDGDVARASGGAAAMSRRAGPGNRGAGRGIGLDLVEAALVAAVFAALCVLCCRSRLSWGWSPMTAP